jgi:Circularly permutated YpsA SLOG family
MLERVISGGQTGADQAGWRAARACGIPTGGFMPLGFLTEAGPRPVFEAKYGASELPTEDDPSRTIANVQASDGTIWLGSIETQGFRTTRDAGLRKSPDYPFLIVHRSTRPSGVVAWMRAHRMIRVANVAGDRESDNPGIGDRVERFLIAAFRQLGYE